MHASYGRTVVWVVRLHVLYGCTGRTVEGVVPLNGRVVRLDGSYGWMGCTVAGIVRLHGPYGCIGRTTDLEILDTERRLNKRLKHFAM